tara:strand:+ start:119 stop:559 length:441 start_codon:yes stop_codon:yes gene_type:complete
MDYSILFLPAALFPAIPLMMINYANRYSSLATLIRKIHDELIENQNLKGANYTKRYLEQIHILRKRLFLNRTFQTLAAISFFVNLTSIFFGLQLITETPNVETVNLFISLFLGALVIFSISIVLFIIELQLSAKALNKHLEDIEEI